MKKDIQEQVAKCEVCQRNKYEAISPAGLLQPLPIPQQVWEDISMDFIIGMPKTQKCNTIMVVVDRLTKFAHFIPLSHPFTVKEVAEQFIAEVVKLHGFPKSIVSDRDRVFASQFWRELFTQSGTTLKYSSGYHPQTDGQTEVVNRSLETYLRCFAGECPKKWVKMLPWAEFWFNTSYNRSLRTTPFKALYGHDPPSIFKWAEEPSMVEEVNEQLRERNTALQKLKFHLEQAQHQMKEQADKKRRDIEL